MTLGERMAAAVEKAVPTIFDKAGQIGNHVLRW